MKTKKKYRFIYYLALIFAVAYIMVISIPKLDVVENQIYVKILFPSIFALIIAHDLLNRKNKEQ